MDAVRFVSDGFEFESSAPVVIFRKGEQIHVSTKVECLIKLIQENLTGVRCRWKAN